MSQLRVPANVSSITISSTQYTPDANGIVTGESDADATTLTSPYTRPKLISTNVVNGQGTVWFPSIVSAITISSVIYNPDASGFIYNVPDADVTLLIDYWNSFILVDG